MITSLGYHSAEMWVFSLKFLKKLKGLNLILIISEPEDILLVSFQISILGTGNIFNKHHITARNQTNGLHQIVNTLLQGQNYVAMIHELF